MTGGTAIRRLVAVAGLSVAGGLFLTPNPASACDPNRPPYCMTPCSVSRDAYYAAYYRAYRAGVVLPPWSTFGVC